MKKGKNVLQDGLINSYSDNNLYIRHANKWIILLILYVVDLIVIEVEVFIGWAYKVKHEN
jgi:hypothetical protein